jgi:hypothetical protein
MLLTLLLTVAKCWSSIYDESVGFDSALLVPLEYFQGSVSGTVIRNNISTPIGSIRKFFDNGLA